MEDKIDDDGQNGQLHHRKYENLCAVTLKRLPDGRKINGQVTEKEIDHQAIKRQNPKSGTEVGKDNGCGHGRDHHKNQQNIIETN